MNYKKIVRKLNKIRKIVHKQNEKFDKEKKQRERVRDPRMKECHWRLNWKNAVEDWIEEFNKEHWDQT